MTNTITSKNDIYLLTAVWLPPVGSSTVHLYTQFTERHKTNNI